MTSKPPGGAIVVPAAFQATQRRLYGAVQIGMEAVEHAKEKAADGNLFRISASETPLLQNQLFPKVNHAFVLPNHASVIPNEVRDPGLCLGPRQ
jgi:hypothetical protein